MDGCDIAVIGAGVIGLACAAELALKKKSIVVIDKNDSFGRETSSRNSEVIHSGLYYPPGSLKAQTCLEGRELLYSFCRENNIAHRKTGKILVAINEAECEKITAIYRNACACGVTSLTFLDAAQIARQEPAVVALAGVWCPDTGIVDTHALMDCLYHKALAARALFSFHTTVRSVARNGSGYEVVVDEPDGGSFSFRAAAVINAAGLYSDQVAAMAGIDTAQAGYKLHYCRGQYFRLEHPARFNIRHLVYPPATAAGLGIHITPDLAGGLRLGPDAAYVDAIDYHFDPSSRDLFYRAVKGFLPAFLPEDLVPDTVGIRPKLQGPGDDLRDFVVAEEAGRGAAGWINLVGIESPGLTACLAIARRVAAMLP